MKKIVITGANGQLGTEIRMASGALPSFEFLYTDYDTLDITDEGALEGFLERECPAFLVNCAAYTAVDRAEQEPAAAKELNARAPGLLARCCLTTGTRLIH
ncbi:MAG TPA: sugar nucleotide-binding protein, partial [Prolixibacteraceae bacterium]|nr:sugar nucleotide-binding protein [Prolixibacteraceae bacterium]